jgi:hypothetical protein
VWAVAESCWYQPQNLSPINHGKNCPRMTCTYLLQLNVSLKNTGPTILLALTAYQKPTFTGWSRTLDMDSVNSSSDYFVYLRIPASETMLQQKRMSTADKSHLRWHTVESKCKN